MPASDTPQQETGSRPAVPSWLEESGSPQPRPAPAPERDVSARLSEAEHVMGAAEWHSPHDGEPPQSRVARERAGDRGEGSLFPSDPRAAFVLLNEARCRAIEGLFGVRRDQVNLMTVIAAMMLGEAVHRKTRPLRRALRPTRADVLYADGILNALGREIAGPVASETPFFAALVGGAAAAAVGTRAVRQSSGGLAAASRRLKRSFKDLLGR